MTSSALARVRLAIAAVVVVASLLAVSAWFKNATCDCGGRGLPWESIAVVATVAAAVAIVAYAGLNAAVRRD
jgi:uncharacterized membrane protein YbhN (UPF0104 family)